MLLVFWHQISYINSDGVTFIKLYGVLLLWSVNEVLSSPRGSLSSCGYTTESVSDTWPLSRAYGYLPSLSPITFIGDNEYR